MKKIVLLLVVLSLVAGQALFAQDDGLKITGHVKTGVNITKAEDVDATAKAYSDDADEDRYVAQLNFVYTKENVGASVRLEANDRTYFGGTGVPAIGHAYGWFSFLGDKVEVSAGWLDNPKWGTVTGFHIDSNLDNTNLVKLVIKPIDGLSLGFNVLDIKEGNRFADSFDNTIFGIRYTAEGSFDVALELAGNSKFLNKRGDDLYFKNVGTKNITGLSKNSLDMGTGEKLDVWQFGSLISFAFTAVENLKIELDGTFAYNKKEDQSVLGQSLEKWTAIAFGASVQGTYTISALDVGAELDFGYVGSEGTAGTGTEGVSIWQLGIVPKASYKITEWLKADIEIPVKFIDNASDKGDGTTYKDWKGGMSIGVKPKFTFDVGNGASFVAFYNLDATKKGYDKNGTEAEFALTNSVQFDFIWSF